MAWPTGNPSCSQGLGHFCEDTWAARCRPRHVPARGWCHPPAAGPWASGAVITSTGVGWCMSHNVCLLYTSARWLIATMSRRTSHQFNPTTLHFPSFTVFMCVTQVLVFPLPTYSNLKLSLQFCWSSFLFLLPHFKMQFQGRRVCLLGSLRARSLGCASTGWAQHFNHSAPQLFVCNRRWKKENLTKMCPALPYCCL